MIQKQDYIRAKNIVDQYDDEQLRLSRVVGKSICPFCSGTKTKPFVRAFANQDCKDCDKDGMISNKNLVIMGLDDCIKKK